MTSFKLHIFKVLRFQVMTAIVCQIALKPIIYQSLDKIYRKYVILSKNYHCISINEQYSILKTGLKNLQMKQSTINNIDYLLKFPVHVPLR